MFKYFLKRLGLMVITFVITIFIFFVFIKLMPDNHIAPIGGDDIWYEQMKLKKDGINRFQSNLLIGYGTF